MPPAPVTICVLTFGDHPGLARRCLESIRAHCRRADYRLVVGGNAVGDATRTFLEGWKALGHLDVLIDSAENLHKPLMMRRMLEAVDSEYVWWFDDDSYVLDADALSARLDAARAAPADVVMWGHQFFFGNESDFSYGGDMRRFVREASWYGGLEPPAWTPEGSDGRWFFITGGNWLMRTSALRALDWPDRRLVRARNDDVLLGEAIRQRGWSLADIGPRGVAINTEPRRGDAGTWDGEALDLQGWFTQEEGDAYRAMASEVHGGVVVELGVWKGRSLSFILDACRERANRVIAVDLWHPTGEDVFAEAGVRDVHEVMRTNLRLLGHDDTVETVREHTAAAAKRFPEGSVDLVFVDADHGYESVLADIDAWWPRLRDGGVMAGHDWTWFEGVRRAVIHRFGGDFELPGGSIWKVRKEPRQTPGRGALFIATHADSAVLARNWGSRPEMTRGLDVFVYDDNSDPKERERVRSMCNENGWTWRDAGRGPHDGWEAQHDDLSFFNRFVWRSLTSLAVSYDFVIKADPDAFPIRADWWHEVARRLYRRDAILGTPEYRPAVDVSGFRDLALAAGWPLDWWADHVPHMQGGIYAVSRGAGRRLRELGFLHGAHPGFGEDCFISYCCASAGVEFLTAHGIGSWNRPYRPPLQAIAHLRAVHPIRLDETGPEAD